MTDERQLDAVEDRLSELAAGERAGLFRRTFLSPADLREALRASPSGRHRGLSVPKWGSIAAAVVIVLGAWTWIATVEIRSVRERGSARPTAVLAKSDCRDQGILNCVGGPTHFAMAGDCAPHDYDDDGDVDLADFSAFQRRCHGITQ